VNIQVCTPDDWDAEDVAILLRKSAPNYNAQVEVGLGQRINGIPLNTILVTYQD
jgi:hypothetical protein